MTRPPRHDVVVVGSGPKGLAAAVICAPGPGVHGMSGMHAARRVLRAHFGIRTLPDLHPR